MSDTLRLVLDGEQVLSYDRRQRLPGIQRRFLDQMDADMDRGIRLQDTQIESPEPEQRLHYVALTLVHAMLDANDNLKLACCAYLADRYPHLVGVVARQDPENIHLQLEFSDSPPVAD